MECGEGAHCGTPPPPTGPPPPPAVTTGNADITVKLEALCWDTFANGESGDNSDRVMDGAEVSIQPASGRVRRATTISNGIASIVDIDVGRATVTVSKTDYETVTGNVDITAGGTATLTLLTRSLKRECDRKHTAKPAEQPFTNWLGPVFWEDQPWILVIRDVVWLLFMIASVVLLLVGLLYPPASGCVAGGALCFAVFAYASHVIFGLIPGVIAIVLGFAMFLALAVFTILSLLAAPPLPVAGAGGFGMPPANIFMFPPLVAIWVGFAGGLAAGRQTFSNKDWAVPIVCGLVAAVIATVVFIVMFAFANAVDWAIHPEIAVGGAIAHFFIGFLVGLLGGLLGHIFINDGNLEAPTWDITDLELPFAGERYCVQGNRGWISHFFKLTPYVDRAGANQIWTTDEENSYDWSFPERHPILAAKEGHIVAFKEDRDGNGMSTPSNEIANYVYVRHRDGTEAHYLHIVKDGFTALNPTIAALGVAGVDDDPQSGRPCFRFTGDPTVPPAPPAAGAAPTPAPAMPVHVHAGQRIAPAGNVGYSMFSHLHFAVLKKNPSYAPGARNYLKVKFKDADVASHEGRCFSMRKYRSDNKDRGPCSL